ncbi:polysaccharide lyase 8 family protein [Yersinia ruckeri]|uniref:polysaccharide lyase 8 family protein n=1 Tax=Yersinia ruckeri TaxID=29486 RepID=UPI001F2DC0FE|nr:polysaccharide lyase 8 family protein [Yersinia ruckeri]EKN4688539.1 polysaccharide lyase 8 family protein [Yersinia ruckeri]UIM97967.1 polysaccharide lyase 8 family protein [Yersinia ruckeri]
MHKKISGSCLVGVVVAGTMMAWGFSAMAQELAPQFDLLAQRWQTSHIGVPAQVFDENQQEEIARIQKEAQHYQQTLLTAADRTTLWEDVPLDNADKVLLGENLRTSFRRLLVLARAYHLPGELFQQPETMQAIVSSLDFLTTYYYHPDAMEYGNWWPWEIGIPKLLNDVIALTYPHLSQQQITAYCAASRYFSPSATQSGISPGAKASTNPHRRISTGGNRTDMVQVVLVRGILDQNETEIRQALAALPDVMNIVTQGDGFYVDHSFIQHEDIPYSGTYGNVLLEGVGRVMALMAGSAWPVNDPRMKGIYTTLHKSFLPLIYRGQMMDMVSGRAISRMERQNHAEGHAVLASMLRFLPAAPESERQALAAAIKRELLADTTRDFLHAQPDLALYYQAKTLLNDPQITPADDPVDTVFYPAMDRLVQRTPNHAFALAWHSYRTGNFECMNDENRHGWLTGDGATYLYDADLTQYTDYWPVINPYRIAGTTTYLDRTLADCVNKKRIGSRVGKNRNTHIRWAGAATLNDVAVAGMQFFNFDDSLRAKKSWFLFSGKLVAIGSDIEGDEHQRIGTVADNRKLLSDGSNLLYLNGKSVDLKGKPLTQKLHSLHIAGNDKGADVGFWFPQQPEVLLEPAKTVTNWSVIGKSQQPVSGYTLSTTLLHKKALAGYQYVLLAGVSKQQLEAYLLAPDIQILQADHLAHAVFQPQTQQLALASWGEGKVQIAGVTTENALALVRQTQSEKSVFSVSDPTQLQSVVQMELSGSWKIIDDPQQRVHMQPGGQLSISTEGLRGQPYTFVLTKY